MRHKAPTSPREVIETLREVLRMIEHHPDPELAPHTLAELARHAQERIDTLEAALSGVLVG